MDGNSEPISHTFWPGVGRDKNRGEGRREPASRLAALPYIGLYSHRPYSSAHPKYPKISLHFFERDEVAEQQPRRRADRSPERKSRFGAKGIAMGH